MRWAWSCVLASAVLWSIVAGGPIHDVSSASPLVQRATAQAGDMCRAVPYRMAVIYNTMYFCGAADSQSYIIRGVNGEARTYPNKLYWINIADGMSTEGVISVDDLHSVDIPAGVPYVTGTGFFHDNKLLYFFAGVTDGSTSDVLWTFDTTTKMFGQVTVSGGNMQFAARDSALMTTVRTQQKSFFMGGYDTAITGMVIFDATNPQNYQWRNVTDANKQGGLDMPRMLEGKMAYIPAGPQGMLIAFGGYDTTNYDNSMPNWGWRPRTMSNISIYDIASNSWYHQEATGDIPANRSAFCMGVHRAVDGSSIQITAFGSWDLLGDHKQHGLYVLSMPSFRWIQVNAANDLDQQNGFVRKRPSCYMRGESQMVVFGGNIIDSAGNWLNEQGCNDKYPVLKALDVSSYTWMPQIAGPEEYSVPSLVSNIIGGGPKGGASLKSPSNGWSDPALASLFSQTPQYTTYDDYTGDVDMPKSTARQAPSSSVSGSIKSSVVPAGQSSTSNTQAQVTAATSIASVGAKASASVPGVTTTSMRPNPQSLTDLKDFTAYNKPVSSQDPDTSNVSSTSSNTSTSSSQGTSTSTTSGAKASASTYRDSHGAVIQSVSPNEPNDDSTAPDAQPKKSKTKTVIIIGGTLGGVCAACMVAYAFIFCARRRRKRRSQDQASVTPSFSVTRRGAKLVRPVDEKRGSAEVSLLTPLSGDYGRYGPEDVVSNPAQHDARSSIATNDQRSTRARSYGAQSGHQFHQGRGSTNTMGTLGQGFTDPRMRPDRSLRQGSFSHASSRRSRPIELDPTSMALPQAEGRAPSRLGSSIRSGTSSQFGYTRSVRSFTSHHQTHHNPDARSSRTTIASRSTGGPGSVVRLDSTYSRAHQGVQSHGSARGLSLAESGNGFASAYGSSVYDSTYAPGGTQASLPRAPVQAAYLSPDSATIRTADAPVTRSYMRNLVETFMPPGLLGHDTASQGGFQSRATSRTATLPRYLSGWGMARKVDTAPALPDQIEVYHSDIRAPSPAVGDVKRPHSGHKLVRANSRASTKSGSSIASTSDAGANGDTWSLRHDGPRMANVLHIQHASRGKHDMSGLTTTTRLPRAHSQWSSSMMTSSTTEEHQVPRDFEDKWKFRGVWTLLRNATATKVHELSG